MASLFAAGNVAFVLDSSCISTAWRGVFVSAMTLNQDHNLVACTVSFIWTDSMHPQFNKSCSYVQEVIKHGYEYAQMFCARFLFRASFKQGYTLGVG